MKYIEMFNDNIKSFTEAKYGIEVIDDKGKRYQISTNNNGDLQVNCPQGNVTIVPQYSNQILIKNER